MNHFYSVFVYAFASLFALVNPIGMSAVFLSMTERYTQQQRHSMAYSVALYGTVLLIVTFFVGPYVLNFFGISLSSIQVAGGIIVFYSAWGMLNTTPKINSEEKQEAALKNADITFFPLTMPITAGAGSMAVTIALAAKLAKTGTFNLFNVLSIMLAIVIVFISVALCYRFADSIFNKLGYTGTNVVSKLAAFILLAISISLISEGILGLITPVLHS